MKKTNLYDAQLAVARRYVQLHIDHPATKAALELARSLLNYKATTPIASDQRLQQILNHQRDIGADPAEVLARVVAFYMFLDHRRGYFKNQRAEDTALGNLVTHAVAMPGVRLGAAVYAPAGDLTRRALGMYAGALLRRIATDADRVAELKAQSAQL